MPKESADAPVSVGAGDTAVNGRTVFARCPCSHCCRVENYTGALTCTNGTSGILCAVCKKGTGIDPITGFDEGGTRYHRTSSIDFTSELIEPDLNDAECKALAEQGWRWPGDLPFSYCF